MNRDPMKIKPLDTALSAFAVTNRAITNPSLIVEVGGLLIRMVETMKEMTVPSKPTKMKSGTKQIAFPSRLNKYSP